jgi:hypothetical protein
MHRARLVRLLKSVRSAVLCALLVIASLPQVAGAHGMAGSGDSPLYLAIGLHSNPVHMANGRCEGGQECSVQAVFSPQGDGPVADHTADSPYQSTGLRMVGWLMAFDPPPPREFL